MDSVEMIMLSSKQVTFESGHTVHTENRNEIPEFLFVLV